MRADSGSSATYIHPEQIPLPLEDEEPSEETSTRPLSRKKSKLDMAFHYVSFGLRVHPVKNYGDRKKPELTSWPTLATTDVETIHRWFGFDYQNSNIGIVPEQLSDGHWLFVFDIDEHDEAESGSETVAELEESYGKLPDTWTVLTPSGGRHLYFRSPIELKNGRPFPGIDIKTSGGFVVAPPSIHNNGGTYEWEHGHAPGEIPLADAPAWLIELLTPKPAEPRKKPQRESSTVWSQFRDSPADRYVKETTWPELLTLEGFKLSHTDRNGEEHWTRPGKNSGTSVTLYYEGNDALHVFSSSIPWLKPEQSYSRFQYFAHRHHNGNTSEAAKAIMSDTRFYPEPFTYEPEQVDDIEPSIELTEPVNILEPSEELTATDTEAAPEQKVNPFGPTLPESFWESRATLRHIRTAARSRRVSPTALLGHVLARVAAYTPPAYCVPGFIGGTVPLSLYVAQVSASGGGKSSPARLINELLTEPIAGVAFQVLGSGEGFTETFLEEATGKDETGKPRKGKVQTRYGAIFELDEGEALKDIASRKGSTILPTLRTAWTGGALGQANASKETHRYLRSGNYSTGLTFSFQLKYVRQLFEDIAGGLPQRFLFLEGGDVDRPTIKPPFPGALDWHAFPVIAISGIVQHCPLEYPAEAEAETDRIALAELDGTSGTETLDAHRNLHRLKLAGVLAVLENRRTVTVEDWELAEVLLTYSDAVRSRLIKQLKTDDKLKENDAHIRAARRAVVVDDYTEKRALDSAVKSVARKAQKAERPLTKRELHHSISGTVRQKVGIEQVIETAIELGYLRENDEGTFTKGNRQP